MKYKSWTVAGVVALASFSAFPALGQSLFFESPSRLHDNCSVLRVANGSSLQVGGRGLVVGNGRCTPKPGVDPSVLASAGEPLKGVRIIGENRLRMPDGRTLCAVADGPRVRLNAC